MQCVIIGIIAARPGCIRIRVSREMSFGPNTNPAKRISESLAAAASLSASSTARAVSIMAQTRIEASDANDVLALADPAGRDRFRNLVAGRGLGVRRHRILEVENDAVGGQDARLFQRPRIRSRHEQQAAARTDHGWLPCWFLGDFRNPTPNISA